MPALFVLILTFLGGTRGEQVDSAYHALMLDIKDGLRQILPEGDREIAISALLRGAESAQRIDPFVNSTLQQVLDFLAELVTLKDSQTAEYRAYVQTLIQQATQCNTINDMELQASMAIVESKAYLHFEARGTHESAWLDMNGSRTAVTNFMAAGVHQTLADSGNALSGACVKPSSNDPIGTWDSQVSAARDWVNAARTQWQSLKSDYSAKAAAESSNATQSNFDQLAFEDSVCQLIADYHVACNARVTCYVSNVENSTGSTYFDLIRDHDMHGRTQLRMIDYVICLIGLMQHDRADEAPTVCAEVMNRDLGTYPSMETNMSDIPFMENCTPGRLNTSARWYPFDTFYRRNFSAFVVDNLLAPPTTCSIEP